MKLLAASLLLASMALAQSPADKLVRSAEEAWAAAVKAGDRTALGNMLSDDLVYTHSTGYIDDKTQYLDKMKSGDQKYTGIEYAGMKVRTFFGNTGVVTSEVRMTGATKNVPFDNAVFVVHVWIKQGSGWKLVSHQTTKKQ